MSIYVPADTVISSIKNTGFETTLYDCKGSGKEKQKMKAGGRSQVIELGYWTRSISVSIVNWYRLSELLDEIKKTNTYSNDKISVITISPMDALMHM